MTGVSGSEPQSSIRRLAPLAPLALALLLAGCGSAGAHGRATLWVTRDLGAHVLLVRRVQAGLTAMQALERQAKVKTRYGGRFVEAIDGLAGSLSSRRDWFYFVNGIEADRSAAEYLLRPGDVEWWDYRSWRGRMEQPVVVGAFPEPFLHGYDGKLRPAVVVFSSPSLEPSARALARVVHGRTATASRGGANLLVVVSRPVRFSGSRLSGGGVRFVVGAADARRLARDPALARFRYEGLP